MEPVTYYYVVSKNVFAIESTEKTSIAKSSRLVEKGRRHHACYGITSPEGLAQLLHEHHDELSGMTQYENEVPPGFTLVDWNGEKFPRPLSSRELEDLQNLVTDITL